MPFCWKTEPSVRIKAWNSLLHLMTCFTTNNSSFFLFRPINFLGSFKNRFTIAATFGATASTFFTNAKSGLFTIPGPAWVTGKLTKIKSLIAKVLGYHHLQLMIEWWDDFTPSFLHFFTSSLLHSFIPSLDPSLHHSFMITASILHSLPPSLPRFLAPSLPCSLVDHDDDILQLIPSHVVLFGYSVYLWYLTSILWSIDTCQNKVSAN